MSKIKCSSCGKEIDSDSNFCYYCGNKINKKSRLLDKLINYFTFDKTPKQFYERFLIVKSEIKKFNEEFQNNEYITNLRKQKLKKDNKNNFSLCINLEKNHNNGILKLNSSDLKLVKVFIKNYENIEKLVKKINKKYIDNFYEEFKKDKAFYQLVLDKYKYNISYDEKITEDKNSLKEKYDLIKILIDYEKSDNYDLQEDKKLIHDFADLYVNFEKVKDEINQELLNREKIVNTFNENKALIISFIVKYKYEISNDLYIDDYHLILKNYKEQYDICKKLFKLPDKYYTSELTEFLEIYDNFKEVSGKINEDYLKRKYNIFINQKDEINSQINKYQNITVDEYIKNKKIFFENFDKIYELLIELKNRNYAFEKSEIIIINNFFILYDDFKENFSRNYYEEFCNHKNLLQQFIINYSNESEVTEYVFDKNEILQDYEDIYQKANNIIKLDNANELNLFDEEKTQIYNFIKLFENFDTIAEENNNTYVKKLNTEFINHRPAILEFIGEFNKKNILDYYIEDNNKLKILKSNENYYNLVCEVNRIPETRNDIAKEFIKTYTNFDEIIFHMNKNYVNNLYNLNKEKIAKYVDIINLKQEYYISNSKLNELLDEYTKYFNIVLDLLEYCSQYEYLEDKTNLLEFPKNSDELNHITKDANEAFIERELKENEELFNQVVVGKPLDNNQRRAVVIDEDNTQIIAGAGCGKTLTLQAKAKYLIEKKNIDPSEILAISFSNYSADDLESKMNQIGLNIDVSTFHSLGLDILRKNKVNARVEEYALKNAIKRYFILNLIDNNEMLRKIIEYFGYYMYEPMDKNKIEKIGEIYDYERGMDLETLYSKFEKLRDPTLKKTSLKGEKVKSLEERRIANFLFINGINYTYEKEYQPKIDWNKTRDFLNKNFFKNLILPEKIKMDLANQILEYLDLDEFMYWPNTGEEVVKYHPDFYLDDYEIYYEHFGVNRKCLAPWLPRRKSREYKFVMRNKQLLHKKYGTKLIETYSYYQSENRLLDRLSEKLQQNGVEFKKINYKQFMIDLLRDEEKINEYWDFIRLVETFINLFKGNGYSKEKFREFRKINEEKFTQFHKQKHELFLDIVEDIYDYYYKYLKKHNLIDFNDMINDAIEKVENNGYYKKYKYILVDEFQDTSHTRFNLLKSLKKDLNAKLVVVGDDWQSIYRFTGCDIDLFTNFEDYFEDSKTEICYITNTYRNSQNLIEVSGNFIMKNDFQFKKQLNSKSNSQIEDTIKLYQYLNYTEQPLVFEAILQDIYESSDDKQNVKVLVLGRNRKDYLSIINEDLFFISGSLADKNLRIHYVKNPRISISYMTVHGSKGLEEENVILINLEDKKNGFPNKIEDDSVLNFVKNEKLEPIEFAEERRLFYVALTRTLKRTYLFAPKDKKSIFVNELMKDIEVIDFEIPSDEEYEGDEIRTIVSTEGHCPECGTGKINLKFNPQTGKYFFKCSNWPRCDWFGGRFWGDLKELDNIKLCPECGGILLRKWSQINQEYFLGCINYYPNKECKHGESIKEELNKNNNN